MYNRSIGGWAKHWDFILLDSICLQIAFLLAYWYRFGSFGVYASRSAYRTSGFVLIFLGIAVAIFFNTMHNVLRRSLWEEARNTVIQCGLVFGAIVVLLFSSKDSDHVSRIVMYVTVGLYALISFVTRLLYKEILMRHQRAAHKHEMLLVGDEAGVEKALRAFQRHPEAGVNIRGVVLLGANPGDRGEIEGVPIVADERDASHYIRNEWIDEVYIACYDYALMPRELILKCSEMAVTIHQQMFISEEVKGTQCVESIAKQPVLTTSIRIPEPRALIIKRAIDIVAGLFLSIVALITLLIVTPIIKAQSRGPVLLRSDRIGKNGRKFKAYTIRTMYMDADERLKEWNAELTTKTDPRIIGNVNGKTGIGYFLRKWSLNELPKGFNILLGSMSLVGTRAPTVEEWERYEYRHRARLACKPGLTGLWEASGRSRTMDFEEATALDTEYIANWSLGLDLKILFKTAALRQ